MRLINLRPTRAGAVWLAVLPFAALVAAYVIASQIRLAENPSDKLLPSLATMGQSMWDLAFTPDRRSGDLLFFADTLASLERLFAGLGISAAIALVVGCLAGFFPYARALFAPFVAAFSLIPPITILPILFITLGLGEAAKIGLIVIGTTPAMIRTLAQAVLAIPEEEIVKAQTLGASSWQIIARIFLPQVWPVLIAALRIGLIPAWIFLISAEAIAATEGLGYRIFLVRRYLAMDVILPYVAWITLLAYVTDRCLSFASRRLFPWAHLKGASL
ncbi:ABC transporter permease [Jiella sonneratiae]|uniref:ABC transporter permease n=1 Tax=Jiella sonneratiae TaxID=2816856 RepID=A0ABS3J4H8_9HYPH|nr:ABC transporter permease [Jiella sonneratiae]MBO0903982.1 ABC transporter permease [Jiella sonneratiae]